MQVTQFPERANNVADRLSGFMAHLRMNGLNVGVGETEAALQALSMVETLNIDVTRMALKAICANDADRYSRFDELFSAYWTNGGRQKQELNATSSVNKYSKTLTNKQELLSSGSNPPVGDADEVDGGEDDGSAASRGEGKLIASKITNVEKTDLREMMMPEDLRRAEQIAASIARRIRDKRSRRRKAAKRGASLDLRRMARASVAYGGEPLKLIRRHRPDRRVNLVALLDVSGSMTVYAKVFLAFLKGLVVADRRTDAYLFHTRLVRISDALRDNDTLRSVNRLSIMANGFGGGTKIGTNLKQFNERYASQSVNGRTVVIILSDGYDTDPPQMMASALARLKRRGCRIIWLNPLKGWRDYQPVAEGMAAALPYLDFFAPANTLESLAALEPHLAKL